MKCPKCQFENPADNSFCSRCGTKILPSEESIGHPGAGVFCRWDDRIINFQPDPRFTALLEKMGLE